MCRAGRGRAFGLLLGYILELDSEQRPPRKAGYPGVEQHQQPRNPWLAGLAALAALSVAGWLGLNGLLFAFALMYRSTSCSPGNDLCGFELIGPGYLLVGMGALTGVATWLGVTVRAVRRHDALSALSIGLLPLVAVGNPLLVNSHAETFYERASGNLVLVGAWALDAVAAVTLLTISVTTRQSIQRDDAVAAVVLTVAVLAASNLVDG
jgi:hypothetical protein